MQGSMENLPQAFDDVFTAFLARNQAGDALQCLGLLKLYVQNIIKARFIPLLLFLTEDFLFSLF